MNTKTITAGLLAVALALGALGLFSADSPRAHAASGEGSPVTGANAGAYFFDMQGATGLRSAIAVADTLTVANIKTLPTLYIGQHDSDSRPSPTGGARENIPISMRFSNSGASVTFALVTFSRIEAGGVVTERLKDVSPTYTATAGSTVDEDGLYVAPTSVLDSFAGWTGRIVLVTSPSAGTVTIRPGSY